MLQVYARRSKGLLPFQVVRVSGVGERAIFCARESDVVTIAESRQESA